MSGKQIPLTWLIRGGGQFTEGSYVRTCSGQLQLQSHTAGEASASFAAPEPAVEKPKTLYDNRKDTGQKVSWMISQTVSNFVS